MADLSTIAAHFKRWAHREFVLFAILPALLAALTQPRPALCRASAWLARLNRRLIAAAPALGRYAWETVVTLERSGDAIACDGGWRSEGISPCQR
jgi:hypothetical protein